MTMTDLIQLRAFARVDGVRLSVLWIASFACYVLGLKTPELGLLSILLALATPFYCARRLKRFAVEALDGFISFGRGYTFVLFMTLNASLLFAGAQFVYFAFLDNGYFIGAIQDMLAQAQETAAMTQGSLGSLLQEGINAMHNMRPIDLALNIMFSNVLIGALLALPVAAFGKKVKIENSN